MLQCNAERRECITSPPVATQALARGELSSHLSRFLRHELSVLCDTEIRSVEAQPCESR
jgi:hypothetical protein